MSYGKPLILLYDDNLDVNVATFSRYPTCLAIDERKQSIDNIVRLENYIETTQNVETPFEVVEQLFPKDTVSAYVNLINNCIN